MRQKARPRHSRFGSAACALIVAVLALPARADEESTAAPEVSNEAPTDELGAGVQAPNVVFADLSMGVLGIAYERAVLSDLSLQIAAQFYRPWYASEHVLGVGGQLRATMFLYGQAPEGFYLSPGMRLAWATLDTELPEGGRPQGWAASWSSTLGYSFFLWEALVLRLGAGVQLHTVDLVGGTDDPDFLSVFPMVDIFAGYAF